MTWSQPVRVSDLPAPSASVMPTDAFERETALAVLRLFWYGAEATDSEDGSGLNNNAANWKVYLASTLDANTPSPTFHQTVASDRFIHGSNIAYEWTGDEQVAEPESDRLLPGRHRSEGDGGDCVYR